MKVLLCILALSVAYSLTANDGVLVGQWNYKGTVYSANQCTYFCCCPTGVINIAADQTNSSQVIVKSTKWSDNAYCKALGLKDITSKLLLPFGSQESFDDLRKLSEDYLFRNGDNELVYYVDGIKNITVSGIITPQLNLTMNQEMIYSPDGESGATCTIILNKFAIWKCLINSYVWLAKMLGLLWIKRTYNQKSMIIFKDNSLAIKL